MMISHSSWPAFGIEKVSKHGDFVAVQRDVQKAAPEQPAADVHRTARYGHRTGPSRGSATTSGANYNYVIKISQLRINES